ncbi:MAG: AMP-binding protein, partial [Pseudomonadota bacterium]
MAPEKPDITRIEALVRNGIHAGSGPCVISGGDSWSRDRFLTKMAKVQTSLEGEGMQPGDIIAVRMGRAPKLVAALCGILSSGGVYLPLDPGYPAARLAYMREDSGAMFELTESGISRLASGKRTDETTGLAYLIYTSGSTGKPKGVAVTHANVINFLTSMIERPGLTPDDRLLAVTTPSFDISVLEFFAPLAAGGAVVLADDMQVRDGQALADMIATHHITMMQATPSTWRLLLETGWSGSGDLKALCGGEELTRSLAKDLLPRVGELWNMYGPTETTVWSSCARIMSADDIHLGLPIAATDIHITDDEGQKLGVGEAGEIR